MEDAIKRHDRRRVARLLCADPPDETSHDAMIVLGDRRWYGFPATTYLDEAHMFLRLARTAKDARFKRFAFCQFMRFAEWNEIPAIANELHYDISKHWMYQTYAKVRALTNKEIEACTDASFFEACLWRFDWERLVLFRICPRNFQWDRLADECTIVTRGISTLFQKLRAWAFYLKSALDRQEAELTIAKFPEMVQWVTWVPDTPVLRAALGIRYGHDSSFNSFSGYDKRILLRVAHYYENDYAVDSLMCPEWTYQTFENAMGFSYQDWKLHKQIAKFYATIQVLLDALDVNESAARR